MGQNFNFWAMLQIYVFAVVIYIKERFHYQIKNKV